MKALGVYLAASLAIAIQTLPVFAADLDVFLDGMLAGCAVEGDFAKFYISLRERAQGTGRTYIPDSIRHAVGSAKIADKGDHYLIVVPLAGQWRGVQVKSLEAFLGKENGINGWSVNFSDPLSKVKKVFGGPLKRSKQILAAQDGAFDGSNTSIGSDSGTAYYVCDLST